MARTTPARDPKKKWTEDRHRLLTIHDGTRLTPAIVKILEAIVDEAREIADDPTLSKWQQAEELDRLSPRLVGRSDGIALYVRDRRIG